MTLRACPLRPRKTRAPPLATQEEERSALPFPELLPVLQPLQDLAFEAALDRLIELLPRHAVGKVVLAREAVGRVVVVLVALAVADLLHEPGRRVQDVHRRRQRA